MGDDLRVHIGGDAAHALYRAYRRNRCLADAIDLAFGRITQFHVKNDVIAINLDIFCGAAADQILAGVRVNDSRQCFFYCFNRNTHWFS
ncbi:hypothetical protein D3C81_1801560 [compost metagenome]